MGRTVGEKVGLQMAKNAILVYVAIRGKSVMICAGIIGDELVGPVRVPDGVK